MNYKQIALRWKGDVLDYVFMGELLSSEVLSLDNPIKYQVRIF